MGGIELRVRSISILANAGSSGSASHPIFVGRVEANADLREEIYQLAVQRQWVIRELTSEKPTLEDVFVELTHADN